MKITFRCDPSLIELLPRPVPAKAALPAWLREMAPRMPSPVHGRAIRTVKQCPPFVDAMTHGFMILLPCDVRVAQGRFEWDWPLPPLALDNHPRAPLSFHVPEQIAGSPLAQGGQSAVKFNSFWTIELEPGWSLMAVHPVNRLDLPFRLLSGLVDADRFHEVGINFPALWTDEGFEGVLPRGTPIAQCYPVPRGGADELICEPMSDERQQGYETLAAKIMAGPGVYRKGFRRKSG
ncbi:hypothetical protein SNE35_10515 [Paucibacter sp. R3-3]|uniref:Suppressor of fused-like domain-containing protein n=1 Tax=Roseateles agri TaxID=3098619 RepID=A0ABU5DF81_9BURK|nr:hypothetical protein [Paucibacter sp. R3-3]MDY0744943.1 hypothetical protein [Paucibacter sp. R3-3]